MSCLHSNHIHYISPVLTESVWKLPGSTPIFENTKRRPIFLQEFLLIFKVSNFNCVLVPVPVKFFLMIYLFLIYSDLFLVQIWSRSCKQTILGEATIIYSRLQLTTLLVIFT